MIRRTTLRPAITLTEVLVALFVMAVGMIALLVLFPLGAMQIGQAIKDQRTADARNIADSIMRNHWRTNVIDPLRSGSVSESNLIDPTNANCVAYMTAMEKPNIGLAPAVARTVVMPDLSDASFQTFIQEKSSPSYPVYVDPNGEVFRRTTFVPSQNWVAGVHPDASNSAISIAVALTRVPRRTLNFPAPFIAGTGILQQSMLGLNWQYRYTTMQDDVDFGEDGLANQSGNGVSKTGRYNWSWMLQRRSQGNRQFTNMSVVVYDQRAFNYARAEDEVAYPATCNVGSTSMTFAYDNTLNPPLVVPSIRAGQWVMDGTIDNTASPPVRNAFFYRVTSVTDTPGATAGKGTITFDLETPIRQPWGTSLTTYTGQIYVLRGVSEVFECRPLTANDSPITQ
ncbi:MAG: hypothetical protein U0798_09005 [Gemmataceae bacterium]